MQGTKLLYTLTLVSGMLECLCFAGAVFGYASLVFVLKEDGYFSQGCVSIPGTNSTLNSTDCTKQDVNFSLVFTLAAFLNSFSTSVNGYIFDRFGTMATRLLGISLYTIGTLLVAFSSPAYSELLFPALSCISVGGIQLLLTNMQVGNLFAAHRSTVITVYNGAFDSSAAVFFIIKVLFEQGISLFSSFIFMSLCSIIHLIRTFLLLPRSHIPYPLTPRYTYGLSCEKVSICNVKQFIKRRGREMTAPQESTAPPAPEAKAENQEGAVNNMRSFRSCVLSRFFLCQLVWLAVMELRHYLFIATLNPTLNRLANSDQELVSQYTNAFALTQLCGVLCAPWNGLIMDRHKGKPLAPGVSDREADLRSSILSLLLTSLMCLMFSVCASIPVLPLQYFTFVLQVLNRSFLYGGNAAFISIAFPTYHFGKLYGLMITMSSIICLVQYPYFALVNGPLKGDPLLVNIVLSLFTLLVFIHPIYIFIHCRKLARTRLESSQSEATGGSILAEAKL
ncbi:solute carrier family 43 member 3a [Betta splendens]|uniref:Solute carrier family 43 member 3a n=1 Tax=Betta splendens TaxID=158456 RepID=A0A6P7NMR9_BETSP|nr:solute carrier family 43 member 3a [Betta splendens]